MTSWIVEAYTASWIEIKEKNSKQKINGVEAYTASWIEIVIFGYDEDAGRSRLIQPRGLKSIECSCGRMVSLSRLIQPRGLKFNGEISYYCPLVVEAYTASWIE